MHPIFVKFDYVIQKFFQENFTEDHRHSENIISLTSNEDKKYYTQINIHPSEVGDNETALDVMELRFIEMYLRKRFGEYVMIKMESERESARDYAIMGDLIYKNGLYDKYKEIKNGITEVGSAIKTQEQEQ